MICLRLVWLRLRLETVDARRVSGLPHLAHFCPRSCLPLKPHRRENTTRSAILWIDEVVSRIVQCSAVQCSSAALDKLYSFVLFSLDRRLPEPLCCAQPGRRQTHLSTYSSCCSLLLTALPNQSYHSHSFLVSSSVPSSHLASGQSRSSFPTTCYRQQLLPVFRVSSSPFASTRQTERPTIRRVQCSAS